MQPPTHLAALGAPPPLVPEPPLGPRVLDLMEAWKRATAAAAHGGLEQAMASAPVVVVCARGVAYEAARAARGPWSAVAQQLLWVLLAEEVGPMGAGLWRQAGLLVLAHEKPQASDRADVDGVTRLARAHHCPVLDLIDAGTPPGRELQRKLNRGTWQAAVAHPPPHEHAAFALPFFGHLVRALCVARARAPEFGPEPTAHKRVLETLEEAVKQYGEQADAWAAELETVDTWAAMRATCGQAVPVHLQLHDVHLQPAARALALSRTHVTVRPYPSPDFAGPVHHDADVLLHIRATATHLEVTVAGNKGLGLTLPWPLGHEALQGRWLHKLLCLLLPHACPAAALEA